MFDVFSESTPMLITGVVALVEAAVIGFLIAHILRRRRAEELLRSAEELSGQIVENSPIGICVISDRRFVYVNQSYVRMFGYSADHEILGRLVEELYTPDERKRQRSFARDRIAGKLVPEMYDTKGLRKDGSHFDVAAWVSIIHYNGTPSSLGYVVDRSVEKQLRHQLEKKNRMEAIGTFAGGIAHDFNNILTAIIGYAELAAYRAGENSEIRSDLQQVQQAGRRAKKLVQQILTFSRNREEKLKNVCLASIVREVLGLLKASLPANIEIRSSLQNEALILGESTQIHQLLMNLCTNAEYAMRGEGGNLGISLTPFAVSREKRDGYIDFDPGDYVCLTVVDEGQGIPEDVRDKIFEPFYTTKPAGEGSGMGLAQVHGIVANHRGHIRVLDNPPHGTCFQVFFPVTVAAPPVEVTTGAEEVSRGEEKILVVDDDEMVLQVLSRVLTTLGYEVTTASGGMGALALVQENPNRFDMVISDLNMPDMTGDNLAVAMLHIQPDLPFVLCTGFYSTIDEAEVSRLGVRAFLEKPVGKEVLASTVRNILDEALITADWVADPA
jgi:PAS domain S-box-containing protein